MKCEKFKIANLVKELVVYIDNSLINFPKKEIELKHKMKDASYNLILIIYESNTISNMDLKIELQERAIALIKYLDFLVNLCYDKQIINGKKYIKFGEKLDTITRYIIAWSNTTKKVVNKDGSGKITSKVGENIDNNQQQKRENKRKFIIKKCEKSYFKYSIRV